MPPFTATALDRLLEPGPSKSVGESVPGSNSIPKPKPFLKSEPVPNSNLARRPSISTTERKANRPQISPALYATPEATSLPESPSSFHPSSPYIINHKRRGPRLLKSFSENDVACHSKNSDKYDINVNTEIAETIVVDSTSGRSSAVVIPDSIDSVEGEHVNGVHRGSIKEELKNGIHYTPVEGEPVDGFSDGEIGCSNWVFSSSNTGNVLAVEKDVPSLVALNLETDDEGEDFCDPHESLSYTSNTDYEDDTGAESSMKLAEGRPTVEFFDAWEALSSENGTQPSLLDVETELLETRLSLLTEIEKRKQAEEALNNMQIQWQRIRQQLALVGLTFPPCPIAVTEGQHPLDVDPAEDLSQQVLVAQFVSDSIGRGIAKAEMEMEMEDQIKTKNIEIARLGDRLHYYETVNLEMSQRNQETVGIARRNRQTRKRRQRWIWGSVAAAITLGSAALAWSYLPAAEGSSSTNGSLAPEADNAQ